MEFKEWSLHFTGKAIDGGSEAVTVSFDIKRTSRVSKDKIGQVIAKAIQQQFDVLASSSELEAQVKRLSSDLDKAHAAITAHETAKEAAAASDAAMKSSAIAPGFMRPKTKPASRKTS